MSDPAHERTSTSLLEALRDPDDSAAWTSFDARHRPLLHLYLRRWGLGDAPAEDAAQETLLHFLRSLREGRYDPAQGRLRAWLLGIARHRALDSLRRERRQRARRLSSVVEPQAPRDSSSRRARMDARSKLAASVQVLRRVSGLGSQTLRVLELTIEGHSVETISAQLGIRPSAVYVARYRCKQKLADLYPSDIGS